MSTDESVRAEPADDVTPDDDASTSGRRRRRRARRDDVATAPLPALDGVPGGSADGAVFVSTATDPASDDDSPAGSPRFWHRAHPVFTPLTGFFTGVLAVVVVLALMGIILEVVLDYEIGEHPWVILVALGALLAVNLALVVVAGTRRFARYMLYGIVTTPLIVFGTAALTLYVSLEG